MNAPVWLIATREFRAYTTTLSFWIALSMGPLLTGGACLLMTREPPPPEAQLVLVGQGEGSLEARFSRNFPLSEAGRAQIIEVLRGEGKTVREAPVKPAPADLKGASRFLMVMLLWVTLIGSLGMLLQSVVRERANRALEVLLAAARPTDIVLGKVAGVGAVSVLVISTWLAAPALLALLGPMPGGLAAGLLQVFGDPVMLARAGAIYLLAFAFYGFLTVMLGALARDNADAQNLARPMFAVLLVVFFTAMSAAAGGSAPEWLNFLPPFTPFMLLVRPASPGVEVLALLELAVATVLAGWGAAAILRNSVSALSFRGLWRHLRRGLVGDY